MARLPFPVEIEQGADWTRSFDLMLTETEADDLTACVVTASLKPRGSDVAAVSFSTTDGNAEIILPNRIVFTLDKTVTETLPIGDYAFASLIAYPNDYDRPGPSFTARVIWGV